MTQFRLGVETEATDERLKKLLTRMRKSFDDDIKSELRRREFPGARRRPHPQQPEIVHPRMPLAEALLTDMRSMQFRFEIVGVQIIGRTIDTLDYAIVRDTKKQKYGEHGERWNFPGGHVLPGEDVVETAIRETWEEAHINIPLNLIKRVGLIRLHPRPGATAPAYAAVFFAVITPEQREGAYKGDEQDELKFVSESELERTITERRFHGNHTNGYREFKRWRTNAVEQMSR